MANTYKLISSNTLTSSAASVTFSSIPSTYTDLVLKVSARGSGTTTDRNMYLRLNGLSTTIYSFTNLNGDGSTASSTRATAQTEIFGVTNANGATASTFSNIEVYIPNYNSSVKKPLSVYSAAENNTTASTIDINAHLADLTTAITSLTIALSGTATYLSGSSFYLYGIKNS